MNKHYNLNDLANNLWQFTESLKLRTINTVQANLGALFNDGRSIESIAKELGYDVKDVLKLNEESGNYNVYTVWVGGSEVLDELVTLEKALNTLNDYLEDDFDDAKIGAYTDIIHEDRSKHILTSTELVGYIIDANEMGTKYCEKYAAVIALDLSKRKINRSGMHYASISGNDLQHAIEEYLEKDDSSGLLYTDFTPEMVTVLYQAAF